MEDVGIDEDHRISALGFSLGPGPRTGVGRRLLDSGKLHRNFLLLKVPLSVRQKPFWPPRTWLLAVG